MAPMTSPVSPNLSTLVLSRFSAQVGNITTVSVTDSSPIRLKVMYRTTITQRGLQMSPFAYILWRTEQV